MKRALILLVLLLPLGALAQGISNATTASSISFTNGTSNVYYRADAKIWFGTNMYISALGTQTNLFKVTLTPAYTGAVTTGAQ